MARLDEVVERLPDGWDTRVGEDGSTLSGGEKQRVSIARALLKDAPIVLLDEATAALDPANEAAVADAIAELARDRTVIVVAHRLATVVAADHILVLDHGRITEHLDHDSLLLHGGRLVAAGSPGQVLTEETVERVYRVRAEITRSTTGRPSLRYLSRAGSAGADRTGAAARP
uniref:Putative ABC iron siderophore transporter, fused permease and ATPase domains n=1 Tax=Nonomuraea gerenzanensis TaxID=93944 RepID=A0A1M4EMI7_9ACTN|nr:Putative ABC iron siderophore transporter, fused permease and ATPase domains [Nonomuraea gerenzanensis]